MDSSVDKSGFTVIRLRGSDTETWPTEVRAAIAVLAGFVETALADEASGPAAVPDPAGRQSGSALRESVEREATKRSDAATAHPETLSPDDPRLRPRGSICGPIDSGPPLTPDGSICGPIDSGAATAAQRDPEIVLVRGRNAYESVSRLLG